jgi:hypothetical protein
MKQLVGYLLNRETGNGIAGKPVTFQLLNGSPVPATAPATYTPGAITRGSKDTVTDANGRFSAWWELSPGPVNIEIASALGPPTPETKVRKWDEQAQLGYQWSSDISRLGRGIRNGVVRGFLNELAVSPAGGGHNIIVATGGAIINGLPFTIENGPLTIAGTPNTNPAIASRLDLISLRQYNETAAGQLAGKQDIVITVGTSNNVAPATPTGSDFRDIPLWVLATAYNGTTKTVPADGGDKREFTNPTVADMVPLQASWNYNAAPSALTNLPATSWVALPNVTLTISGMSVAKVYDGYLSGIVHFRGNGQALTLDMRMAPNNTTPGLTDTALLIGFMEAPGVTYNVNLPFFRPLTGITGVTTFTVTPQFRQLDASGSPFIPSACGVDLVMQLVPRV